MKSAIIGYPYIGENQEWIHTRELFRTNKISSNEFKQRHIEAMMASHRKQKEMGLDVLTVGDFPMLDRMLDTAFMFNLIPSRFKELHKQRTLELYFDMAYGQSAEKCTLNNWFTTSYCYVEPEFENQDIRFKDLYFKDLIEQCKHQLQCVPRVTLIGPMTLLLLTKGIHQKNKKHFRDQLLNGFLQAFKLLQRLEIEWVQLEEPALAYNLSTSDLAMVRYFYQQLAEHSELKVMLTVPYEMPQHAQVLAELPVAGIGFDVSKKTFPDITVREHTVIALGIIDATNIWAINEKAKLHQINDIQKQYPQHEIWLQTSASLIHVPITKKDEWLLVRDVFRKLSFADEKIAELVQLVKLLDADVIDEGVSSKHEDLCVSNVPQMPIKKAIRSNIGRRWRLQQAFLQLPQAVLTTNDFQIDDVNALNDEFVRTFTTSVIDLPAYIPLAKSKLIHLVAEHLLGMVNTKKGVILISFNETFKPPIQYENIQWKSPIFLPYLQELKKDYVLNLKLVMPGPITMIKSAFLRQDFAYDTSLKQMMHAFMLEVQSLEHRDIQMIQFEEPWLYRKLPVKFREQQKYLKLEMEMLHTCISSIREMIVVQVNTQVWKRNYNELLKSNVIDVVSLNLMEDQCVLNLLDSLKGIKVSISMNVSWFIDNEVIYWEQIKKVKAFFNNQMLWFNVDIPQEEMKKYHQMLKEIKKEKFEIPLRYVNNN